GVAKGPAPAVAAATAGDTRWVRPPGPCRPSKLRLLVDADRSPGARMSPFMPRHIEQPAQRRPRHDDRAVLGAGLLAPDAVGGGREVGQPAVGARADEHRVDRDVPDG